MECAEVSVQPRDSLHSVRVIDEEHVMAFTLRLLTLECIQAQELDGDEAYLMLDDRRVWEAGDYRMSNLLMTADRCSQVDFANGRALTRSGWVETGQTALIITGLAGDSTLQLWERDTLTPDDLLGETPISEADSERGEISVLFTRDGGHYRLTYRVEAAAQ